MGRFPKGPWFLGQKVSTGSIDYGTHLKFWKRGCLDQKFPLINSTMQLEQGRKRVSMGNKLKGILVCQVEMMTAALEWRREYTSHWLGVKSKRGSKKTLRLEVGWLPKRWSSLTTWRDTMTRMEAKAEDKGSRDWQDIQGALPTGH